MRTNDGRIGRRDLLRKGAGLAVVLVSVDALAACGSAPPATAVKTTAAQTPSPAPTPTPLAAPETTTIRLTAGPCDAPIMAAERFLREEGFTDVQITDAASIPAITGGKADLGQAFVTPLVAAIEAGKPIVGLAGLHPGCAEVWAPRAIASLKDLRGRTVIVRAKTADDLAYTFLAIALKESGVDPKDVNFVAQANADPTKEYLEGRSDAVFVTTTAAVALRANSANRGHVILEQTMAKPWSEPDCCILSANAEWTRANPVATKRAVRAVLRAADSLGADRGDAVKVATDKGLFGGAKNFESVRGAANMVPLDWRALDPARSVRFHAQLMADVGLSKMKADDAATKGTDLRVLRELQAELKR